MRQASVLITDLDNTLFDWFSQWYHSFEALIDGVAHTSGISRKILLNDARTVHQRFHTSEYAFLLEEMPCLKERYSKSELLEVFDDAIHAYRSARKRYLKLYPTVLETLTAVREAGALIVGYTESMAFYSAFRIKRLELDGVLDCLFSPPDHEFSDGIDIYEVRSLPSDTYGLKKTVHKYTPKGELKPNPALLLDIIEEIGAKPSDVVYVGDSAWKDIMMARDASVTCALAEYGRTDHTREYELLRRVTHWSDEDVERERESRELYDTRREQIAPTFELRESYGEILNHINFKPFVKRKAHE